MMALQRLFLVLGLTLVASQAQATPTVDFLKSVEARAIFRASDTVNHIDSTYHFNATTQSERVLPGNTLQKDLFFDLTVEQLYVADPANPITLGEVFFEFTSQNMKVSWTRDPNPAHCPATPLLKRLVCVKISAVVWGTVNLNDEVTLTPYKYNVVWTAYGFADPALSGSNDPSAPSVLLEFTQPTVAHATIVPIDSAGHVIGPNLTPNAAQPNFTPFLGYETEIHAFGQATLTP